MTDSSIAVLVGAPDIAAGLQAKARARANLITAQNAVLDAEETILLGICVRNALRYVEIFCKTRQKSLKETDADNEVDVSSFAGWIATQNEWRIDFLDAGVIAADSTLGMHDYGNPLHNLKKQTLTAGYEVREKGRKRLERVVAQLNTHPFLEGLPKFELTIKPRDGFTIKFVA